MSQLNNNFFSSKSLWRHLLFWSVFLLWALLITHWTHVLIEAPETVWGSFKYTIQRIPLIVICTYSVINWLLPRYVIGKKDYLQFVIILIPFILFILFLDRIMVSLAIPADHFEFFNVTGTVRNAYLLLTAIGAASILKLFRLYLIQEKIRYDLMEDQLGSQLDFLRAQMNPHFLFNALNGIYSMAVQRDQEEIASSLENLSGIMRYLTYDGNLHRVPLTKEIRLIQDFIEIQYLRFQGSDTLTVSFTIDGEAQGRVIAPLVLLPFVENAFKHGVRPEEKGVISIQLKIKEDRLNFCVKNSLYTEIHNDKGPGIGLENVKKRLDLIYPNKFVHEVDQNNLYYTSNLSLQIE